ncbi:MAG: hypothetical protein ABIG11_06860, partial [bacterium]
MYAIFSADIPALGADRPNLLDLPKNIFKDSVTYVKTSLRKENIPAIVGMAAATGILVHYDQDMLDGVQKFGKRINISGIDKTKAYLKFGKVDIFRGPSDTGSALYFLGDGWLHFSICGGFYGYGLFGSNDRALRTGYALMRG